MTPFQKAVLAGCIVFGLSSCTNLISNKQPDKLIVKRLDPLHQSDLKFEKTINDKEQVQKLYDKIENLSPFPKGTIHCPDDNGVQYEINFFRATHSVAKALVNATGCQEVKMDGKVYWAMEPKGNGFRAQLERMIGLNHDQF